VGRDGLAALRLARRGDDTVLVERRFRTPLQVLEPLTFPGDPAAGLMLLNPTGGVLGGDHLETQLRLDAGAHAVVTTPSATRVYGCRADAATLVTTAAVGLGAVLEYVPDHLIPHPRARVVQRLSVRLAPAARLLLWDAWALGRVARGEAWTFDRLQSAVRVDGANAPVFIDRASLRGGRGALAGLGGAEACGYVAWWLAVSDETYDWARLADELSDVVAAVPGLRAAGSALGRGGCAVRVLAGAAHELLDAQRLLWSHTRTRWLGLAPIDLRKS
jgi:urease accessory protein